MPTPPIQTPSAYVASRAAAYADIDGTAILVSTANPLPVSVGQAAAAATPLAGSTAITGVLGPYAPATGRAVILTLSGTWTGSVKLTRSADGGTTKLPITVGGQPWAQFTTNCCEAVWEESESAARLYLDVTLASGTLNYRIAQ